MCEHWHTNNRTETSESKVSLHWKIFHTLADAIHFSQCSVSVQNNWVCCTHWCFKVFSACLLSSVLFGELPVHISIKRRKTTRGIRRPDKRLQSLVHTRKSLVQYSITYHVSLLFQKRLSWYKTGTENVFVLYTKCYVLWGDNLCTFRRLGEC